MTGRPKTRLKKHLQELHDQSREPWRMSEHDLQYAIIQAAELYGWLVAHFRPAQERSGHWATPMSGNPGFPDLVLVRPPRLIFAELKSDKGTVRPDQEVWLEKLRGIPDLNVSVYVWRPADLDDVLTLLA